LQRAETASLELLRDKKYASVLCYPRYSATEAVKRIRQLKRLGVSAIEFGGQKTAFNLPVLGKGCVGIVVAAQVASRRVALKIRRVDADRKEMEHEAEMLSKANRISVGPRLLGLSQDFLLMEFIEGLLLPAWIQSVHGRGSAKRIRQVLREIVLQCRKMDEAGLDHGELSRAPKHVIVGREDKVRIVDFETASVRRRASNVTSISQYLFIGSQVAKTLRNRLGEINRESLIAALRYYKRHPSERTFRRILEICQLTE